MDYQRATIDFFKDSGHSKVTTLQTGKGKSLIFLHTILEMGKRTLLTIPGMYVYKWKGDILEELDMRSHDLMIIRGADALISAINLGKAGELKAKIIIVTSTTLYNFYKDHKNGEAEKYGCHPQDLMEVLGIGLKGCDEVHEKFHLNFIQDLYTNVAKTVSLSATLDTDDRFINDMLHLAFPPECRINALDYDKYIDVYAIEYGIENVDNLRYMGGNKMYSHTTFEQSILKTKKRTNAYLNMVQSIVDDRFIAVYEKGIKCAIYASSVEMCTALADYIAAIYPTLTVRRYVSEDPDEVLYESDVVVTTHLSAGTAVDIPNLDVVILTVALGSKQRNEQVKGRLRKHKVFTHRTPKFYYLYARDIDKHKEYHERKKENFRGKVLTHKELISTFKV
jgi:superfamily II DNA or RNA helicase